MVIGFLFRTGYLIELCKLKQAQTQMSFISSHKCSHPVWFGGCQDSSHRGFALAPLFSAQAWPPIHLWFQIWVTWTEIRLTPLRLVRDIYPSKARSLLAGLAQSYQFCVSKLPPPLLLAYNLLGGTIFPLIPSGSWRNRSGEWGRDIRGISFINHINIVKHINITCAIDLVSQGDVRSGADPQ